MIFSLLIVNYQQFDSNFHIISNLPTDDNNKKEEQEKYHSMGICDKLKLYMLLYYPKKFLCCLRGYNKESKKIKEKFEKQVKKFQHQFCFKRLLY